MKKAEEQEYKKTLCVKWVATSVLQNVCVFSISEYLSGQH